MREQFSLWIQENSEHWLEDDTARLLESIAGFLESRKAAKKPIKTKRAVTLLCNRLQEFSSGSPAVMADLLDTAVLNGWQSVYRPKQGSQSPRPRKEDDVEWLE